MCRTYRTPVGGTVEITPGRGHQMINCTGCGKGWSISHSEIDPDTWAAHHAKNCRQRPARKIRFSRFK